MPSTVSTEFHRNDLNFIAEDLETRSKYNTFFAASTFKTKEKLYHCDETVYWISIGHRTAVVGPWRTLSHYEAVIDIIGSVEGIYAFILKKGEDLVS